jgi:beta-glucosidase
MDYLYAEKVGIGFAALIDDYYRRYNAPIIITETSAFGRNEARSHWLAASVAAIKSLRGRGVPVLGYTWFPLFTMIDWKYRLGRGPIEEYRIELGLYTLDDGSPGSRWRATPLVDQYHGYVNDPEHAIGPLNE